MKRLNPRSAFRNPKSGDPVATARGSDCRGLSRSSMNILEKDGSITFTVRVIPRSSRTEIVSEHDGVLKVKLASPPVEGAANAELIKLFAKKLGVSKSAVTIISGETSKTKRLRVDGVDAERLRSVLAG